MEIIVRLSEKEIDAIAPIKTIIDIGNSTVVVAAVDKVGFSCSTFEEEEILLLKLKWWSSVDETVQNWIIFSTQQSLAISFHLRVISTSFVFH